MSTMRAFALMEAERLALNESMNAMIQLAEVRERMYSESHEQNTDLHSQVLAAEKLHEEAVDKADELLALMRERQTEHNAECVKLENRERRILAVLDKAMAMLPPGAFAEIQGYRNAALADEILF